MKKKKNTCLLLAGALLCAMTGCAAQPEPERLTTYAMGSVVQQTVYGEGAQTVAADAAQVVQELENTLSWRVAGSDIARLNDAAGKERVQVSLASTSGLLYQAQELCRASGGAFDVTIGPVSRLWDFDGDPHVPDPEKLAAALALVDYQKLARTEESSFDGPVYYALRDAGMAVDLGAVGKGFACDAALQAYRNSGSIAGAVIAVGGSVAVFGQKPDGSSWRVAVRDPKTDGTLGEIEMNSGYVSTSGSYEKTFTENGKTYHHILDPRTGYPAESGLVSMTVWMPSVETAGICGFRGFDELSSQQLKDLGMEPEEVRPSFTSPLYNGAACDALSTACFVLGLEDSLPLLEKYGAEGIFITEDDEIYCTDGIRESFTLDESKGYTLTEALP